MATYILSFVIIAIVMFLFSNADSFQSKFKILLLSALISMIPTTLVNGIKGKEVVRQHEILKSKPLEITKILINSVSKDTSLTFVFKNKDNNLEYQQRNEGFFEPEAICSKSDSIFIVYIKVDSLNHPRWEVSADVPIKTKSLWYSSRGIPNINKEMRIYIPDDSIHHAIVRRWINEKS